jgi:transposase InsO family protein
MKEHGIVAKTVRKYKATTNSKHNLPVSDNLLNQDFTASAPNEKWVSDITYVWTSEGWMYLASIMDLYSRKIVGWHADNRMTKELVLTALERAVKHQNVKHKTIVHHSDRGS